jgi:NAD(P)H-dependent FMN reductase
MTRTQPEIVLIIGSVRKARIGPKVAEWFLHHVRCRDVHFQVVGTRNGVVIHAPWDHLADGTLELDDAAVASALTAVDELTWWADLLKPARVADQGVV